MKNLLIAAGILSAFGYGMAVGNYRIFPFEPIRDIVYLASGGLIEQEDDREAFFIGAYYRHKTSFFELHARENYDVVFIGDSLIDGADWYDIFPAYRIANRGVGGDSTAGVLNRMDTIINTRAKTAFIMIGVNDINDGISMDIIVENYTRIIEQLGSLQMDVVVQSTLLTDGIEADNSLVMELNKQVRVYCEENAIRFIDLNKHLSKNGYLDPQLSSDGVHLNGVGYQRWSALIEPYLTSSIMPSVLDNHQ